MSIISTIVGSVVRAFTWLTKNFTSHIVDADKVAVTITETVKTLLANPVTNFLLNIADAVTGSQVPTNVAAAINAGIVKVLAAELAIEGLPDNPTPAQILAFEQSILAAFNINSNNSKLYTVLSAQIYGIIQSTIANGSTNFAGWVNAIQAAYNDLQLDLQANAVPVASTNQPPISGNVAQN